MIRPVYWHQWVSSSTSPSALPPRIRCLKAKHSKDVWILMDLKNDRHWRVWNPKCSIIDLQTLQEVVNLQPNVTKSSGLCDADRASLQLTTDAEKTNLTFFFTLVSCFICTNYLVHHNHVYKTLCHLCSCWYYHLVLPKTATRWQLELEVNLPFLRCYWLLVILLLFSRILHPISTTSVKCPCQQPGQTWKVSAFNFPDSEFLLAQNEGKVGTTPVTHPIILLCFV